MLRPRSSRFAVVVGVATALLAAPALAQYGQSTGGIHGKAVDEQGGVLSGVEVVVRGRAAPQTALTDARGEFHVVNLPPDTYTVILARQSFATLTHENVIVNIGRDTELVFTMKLSSVSASATVTAEAPVLDTRRVATGAAVTQDELKSIPTARDPWVILQSIPGIQIDRINVAGSESGQQSAFASKGSQVGTFQVDGVNMTDMSALGGSAAYYDFDSFQEMQVITGGSDPSLQGSGAHLNMVTKRGTNDLHGSVRVFAVDHHFQSANLPDEARTQKVPLTDGNHIDQIQDYGAESGGPIWRDHLWLWGSYGRDQINLITIGGAQKKTTLEDTNGKLNWQVVPSNAVEVWYLRSDKLVLGRGAGPTRTQPTTWDQTLPQNTWKVQDSQVFSSSLFASAQYSGQNGSFVLTPESGLNPQAFLDADGVWHNSYGFYSGPRPQRQVKADGSFFFSTGSLGHELKAGFSYLKASARSESIWSGFVPGLAQQTYGDLFDCAVPCAVITRNGSSRFEARYYSAFAGDTITLDRLTVNLAIRWDRQYGNNLSSAIPANGTYSTILPPINYPGQDRVFTWNDYQPRVGLTYALGANRATLLKASYARYAEALGTGTIAAVNPVSAAYAYYAWNDTNRDNLVQPGEVDTSATGFQFARGYDPALPAAVFSPNAIDPNLKAPTTEELIVGLDHELLHGLAVGVNYTYRKFKDFVWQYPFTPSLTHFYDPTTGRILTSDDYELARTITETLPDGTVYSAPVYRIKQSVLDAVGDVPAGSWIHNRSDFNETYTGLELTMTKRLANHWMARGNFVYNTNRQHGGTRGCIDPTNLLNFSLINATSCASGDSVAVIGGKAGVFLNSKWQFNVSGVYQFPLGFNLAGNLYGRQGYPILWFRRDFGDTTDGLTRDVVVTSADAQRYENVYELDLRIEKVSQITSTATLTLSADLFNATNQNTVLQRQNRLGLTSTNTIREIQSPRIWRFGARIAF